MPKPDENPDVIEADAEEMHPDANIDGTMPPTTRASVATSQPSLAVAPQVQAAELVTRMNVIREAAAQAMEEGVDYGKVPGTDRDTLFKPGAEKLGVLFRLDVQPENEKRWEDDGHLTVISRATVYDAPTGARLGSGEGICSTREEKYAYRNAKRKCPECGEKTIIKGKEEYGGGWVCFKKLGGCNAKFPDGDKQIESQEVGKVANEGLPDLYNTVDKMASKRARVDAVLAVTGASAIFTQDLAEEGETPIGNGNRLSHLANEVEKESLRTDLKWLLPPDQAKEVWGKIKAAFQGELYAPAVNAVCVVIRAHKANVDAEVAEAVEAHNAEKAASDG